MSDIALFAALLGGLVILAASGDLLVTGAVSVARQLKVSPLITGILIVGFGTSLPEMLVGVNAVLQGSPALAIGNIIGSNIANIWFVLAIPAFLTSMQTGGFGQTRALILMLLATAIWIGFTALSSLTPLIGIALFVGLFIYIVSTLRHARTAVQSGLTLEFDETSVETWKPVPYILVGIIGLPLGASLMIEGSIGLARNYQISEEIIGLSLLAIGTSLPEIGAGIAAALRGRADVVIGSIIGSNVFNLMAVGGLISLFGPVEIAIGFKQYDYWAMALAALTLALYILPKARISRLAGLSMILIYLVYLYGLVSGWNILGGVQSLV